MPIYEYRCGACAESFERLVRLGTPTSSITCPECGEKRAERKVSGFATRTSSSSKGGNCGPSGFS